MLKNIGRVIMRKMMQKRIMTSSYGSEFIIIFCFERHHVQLCSELIPESAQESFLTVLRGQYVMLRVDLELTMCKQMSYPLYSFQLHHGDFHLLWVADPYGLLLKPSKPSLKI